MKHVEKCLLVKLCASALNNRLFHQLNLKPVILRVVISASFEFRKKVNLSLFIITGSASCSLSAVAIDLTYEILFFLSTRKVVVKVYGKDSLITNALNIIFMIKYLMHTKT